jgi:hypothetical protein
MAGDHGKRIPDRLGFQHLDSGVKVAQDLFQRFAYQRMIVHHQDFHGRQSRALSILQAAPALHIANAGD